MADERLRELERSWNGGDLDAADAYDSAWKRAGLPGLSPSRRQALQSLHAVLRDAFDPKHLVTPCCGDAVFWSSSHVTAEFSMSRALLCRACTWATGGRHLARGRPRQLATIRTTPAQDSIFLFPLILDDLRGSPWGGGGFLNPHVPAPIPTKLVAGFLTYGHEIRGTPHLDAMAMLEMPFRTALSDNLFLHPAGAPVPGFTQEDLDAHG